MTDVIMNSSAEGTVSQMRISGSTNFVPLNRSVSYEAFVGLIFGYVCLGLTGVVGNSLVCSVVFRNKQMRTARNMLIVNLAASDLILCTFTMPFSLVQIITKYWPLGTFMCKAVSSLQATSVFVSTMNITIIALDRYKLIVYPTKSSSTSWLKIMVIVVSIWIIALGLSSPLFMFRTVDYFHLNITGYETIGFCYEQWPVDQGATIYSIATMVFQYLFPTIALIFSYSRICRRLQDRMGNKGIRNVSSEEQRRKRKKEEWRVRRTNYLLVAIAFVFAVTWLPLNILNIVSDLVTFKSPEKFMTTFGCCHMLGMTSACSNPIIYGWFNENFQKEFRKIFSFCTSISAKNDANRGVNVRSPKEDVQCENKSLVKL